MRILLIDDSVDMGHLVGHALAPYEIHQACSLADASEMLAKDQYNLLLIDVDMPDGSGFSFCDDLVRTGHFENVPKVFLTAHSQISDKVFGLNCGADDYITKPFSTPEFRARIDTRLRNRKQISKQTLRLQNFEFDSDFQKCWFLNGNQKVDLGLTPTEYRIFLILAKIEGRPMSRSEMVRSVWSAHGLNIEARGIDTHVAHLRKKLLPHGNWIVSVYGKGYAFQKPTGLANAA